MHVATYLLNTPYLKGLRAVLSPLFRAGVALRHLAYDCGYFKAHAARVPVISIGNIAVGGTGKTPLVHLLAKELTKKGPVAILTRGYKSQIGRKPVRIKSGAEASRVGDEPAWLAQQLPEVAIWVGSDRVRALEMAMRAGAHFILLDDGMQKRAVKRDLEIVLLDGEDPLGKGAFLPQGLLRDSPKRLQNAHLIIFNHVYDKEHFQKCQKQLASFTTAKMAAMHYRFSDEAFLKDKKVGAFCALGRPEHFLDMLRRAQCDVVDHLWGPDHAPFDETELETFAIKCQAMGAETLVCTEKDAVKLAELKLALPIKVLQIEIVWTSGEQNWKDKITNIEKKS